MDPLSIAVVVAAAAVSAGTPILLAGLGELITEKAGVLNLGVEGMMLVGALAGFAGAQATGSPWAGVLIAAGAGGALALLHAVPVVLLGVDQVVSGLALIFVGTGVASAFGRSYVGQVAPSFSDLPVPGLSDLPVLGPVFFSHDPLVYLSLALVLLVAVLLRRARLGLALQICGENPRLVDISGLSVIRIRLLATVTGGALAGVGGAWLSLADTPSWMDGMSGGRGWIALAMVIFSAWSPWRLLAGAWLFGGLVALQFRVQAFGVDAPIYLLKMLPYVATLVVLVLRGRAHQRAPAALGLPYARERRG